MSIRNYLPCIFKTWKFSLSNLTITPTVSASKLTKSPHSNFPRESTPLAMSLQSCKSLGRISISCMVRSEIRTTLLFSTRTTSPVSPSYRPKQYNNHLICPNSYYVFGLTRQNLDVVSHFEILFQFGCLEHQGIFQIFVFRHYRYHCPINAMN